MSSIVMLKKLGAKQITGDVKKIVRNFCANDGDKIALYTIIGVANGIKTGTHTTYGAWLAFTGSMEAENHVTQERFASNIAFIPAPLDGMLREALGSNESVQFAITVEVKRRDDLGQGYEYLPRPHIATQENDPLAHLRQAVPKIEAPKALNAQSVDKSTGEVVEKVEAKKEPETKAAKEEPKAAKGK